MEVLCCPFCGSNNLKLSCDDFGWGQFRIRREAWWIQCQGEHCYALQQGSTQDKVIARWNKRFQEKKNVDATIEPAYSTIHP